MLMPKIVYGLAWKKEATTQLVIQAVKAGFRGIDTAGQWKHYREDLLGRALHELQSQHGIARESLWIQTKFTSIAGQDLAGPMPYDPEASVTEQVKSSVATSLKNLGVSYIDSLVLHSPLETKEATREAWRTLEDLVDQGVIKQLGLSNIYQPKLLLWVIEQARVPVSVVQNRWYQGNGWDWDVYQICQKHEIRYQSFWTLSGSPSLLNHPLLLKIAEQHDLTPEQTVYKLAQTWNITPLSGTKNEEHMMQDLEVEHTQQLEESEVEQIATLMGKP